MAQRFAIGLCPTLRFYRRVLPRFARPALRVGWGGLPSVCALGLWLWRSVALDLRVRPCGSIAVFYLCSRPALQLYCGVLPSFTPGIAALLPRFASVCARHCGSIAAFFLGSRSALRFCRRGLPSVCARRCGSVVALCLSSRLSFFPCQEKRSGLRYLAFLFRRSRSPLVRSRCVSAVIGRSGFTSGLAVYLWRSRRSYRGRGQRGTRNGATRADGAAFVHLCAAALALQCFPRGVRWGCAPQTAPKSLRLSGLSSRCGGVMLVQKHILAKSSNAPTTAPTRAKPGHTERPDRL